MLVKDENGKRLETENDVTYIHLNVPNQHIIGQTSHSE